MFGIGFSELAVILFIALLLVGPARLPELARSLGKGLVALKRPMDEFRQTFEEATQGIEDDLTVSSSNRTGPSESPVPQKKEEQRLKEAEEADDGEVERRKLDERLRENNDESESKDGDYPGGGEEPADGQR